MNPSDWKYLTKDQREACKSSPEAHLAFVPLGKQRVESMHENYSLSKNLKILKSDDKEELRIVVIGKTGVGKSATANTILGKKIFKEDVKAQSVTSKSKCFVRYVEGRKIRVIDTPGLLDTHQSKEVILAEIARVIQIFDSGIHAFLYVFNMASPRFTEEDRTTLKAIEEKFGGHMVRYRIVVYTHAECNLGQKMNLDSFVRKQKNSNQLLKAFFEETNDYIVAVNNRPSIPAEKKRNQEVIIAMVDKLREVNKSHPVYTNSMFNSAPEKRIELKNRALSKGWNPKLLTVLQTVYAFNADLLTSPMKLLSKLKSRTRKREELSKEFEDETMVESSKNLSDEIEEMEELHEETDEIDELDQSVQLVDAEFTENPDDIQGAVEGAHEKEVEEISQDLLHNTKSFQTVVESLWQFVGSPW